MSNLPRSKARRPSFRDRARPLSPLWMRSRIRNFVIPRGSITWLLPVAVFIGVVALYGRPDSLIVLSEGHDFGLIGRSSTRLLYRSPLLAGSVVVLFLAPRPYLLPMFLVSLATCDPDLGAKCVQSFDDCHSLPILFAFFIIHYIFIVLFMV